MRPSVTIVPIHGIADIEACHERLHAGARHVADRVTGPDRRKQPRECEGSAMTRESFGTRLRSLRERAGLTLKQRADMVGTNEYHIATWERNMVQPEMAMVERLAAALGVPSAELLTGRPTDQQKCIIRLTADKFADHLSTTYPASLVKGFNVPEDGIDIHDFAVSKLLAWMDVQSERSQACGTRCPALSPRYCWSGWPARRDSFVLTNTIRKRQA
jgi:transcriptional regulator with XRE-family HTH domain